MSVHFYKQFTCLVPALVSLLMISGVAYVQNVVSLPVTTSNASFNDNLDDFTDDDQQNHQAQVINKLSAAQLIPSTTNIRHQQQTAVNAPQAVRFSFINHVKQLSVKYNILVPYLLSHNSDQHREGIHSLSELQCMALNLYFEARGETSAGQKAVGHVVLNRVNHAGFPKSVCGVVKQGEEGKRFRCQFSWWCDGRSDQPRNQHSWRQSILVAAEVFNETKSDPTHGALWYHADYVNPYWKRSMEKGPKIGKHIFYSRKKTSPILSASS